jgi:hypothetical protein
MENLSALPATEPDYSGSGMEGSSRPPTLHITTVNSHLHISSGLTHQKLKIPRAKPPRRKVFPNSFSTQGSLKAC